MMRGSRGSMRAAHVLAPYGAYVDGPPPDAGSDGAMAPKSSPSAPAAPPDATPRVHHAIVLFSADAAAARDVVAGACDAPPDALRGGARNRRRSAARRRRRVRPAGRRAGGAAAVRRATVVRSARWRRGRVAQRAGGARADADDAAGAPPLWACARAASRRRSSRRSRAGGAVLRGPPGTGKSQTIANVICHYLATGRRVLVTSKGAPATEVLRQKLPHGVRELCVALGGAPTRAARAPRGRGRALADDVAGAPRERLDAAAERRARARASRR